MRKIENFRVLDIFTYWFFKKMQENARYKNFGIWIAQHDIGGKCMEAISKLIQSLGGTIFYVFAFIVSLFQTAASGEDYKVYTSE